MSTYLEPSATIQQEFATIPSAIVQTQRTTVVGPRKKIVKSTGANASSSVYGSYIPGSDTLLNFAGVPAGGSVVADSVSVTFNDLLAKYATISGTNAIERGSTSNQIKLGSSATGAFVANSASVRNINFKIRDVQVGDRVKITPSGLSSFTARITGFLADTVAPSVGTFSPDSGNQTVLTATANSSPCTAGGTIVSGHSAAVSTAITSFQGDLALGYLTDTYVIECVTGGVGAASVWNVTSTRGDNIEGVAGVATGSPMTVGTKGLKIIISDSGSSAYAVGEKYTRSVQAAYTPVVPVAVSTSYTGAADTTYFVEVVKGGKWANSPQVAVRTSNGVDYGSARTVSTYNAEIPLGRLGATFKFSSSDLTQGGLRLGDIYQVNVTASASGAIRTALISTPIPTSVIAGDDLAVDFLVYKSSIEIPASGYPEFGDTNWSVSGNTFTLKAGIDILDSTWLDNDGVTKLPLAVTSASVVAEYQILETLDANIFGTISDLSLVESTLGEIVPENKLAYGVFKALQNSSGISVHYLQVASDDQAGYQEALTILESEDEAYFLVPQTNNRAIIDDFKAHVLAMSSKEKGMERVLLSSLELESTIALYEKVGTTSTYYTGSVAANGAGHFVSLHMPTATLLTSGVRAGDIVRSNYRLDGSGTLVFDTAIIDSVTDEQNAVLYGSGFATAIGSLVTPVRIGIYRALTKNEQAVQIASNSSSLDVRRVYNVWPDQIVDDSGNTVGGYTVAAASAGLASSVAPQQPITNYTLTGFSNTLKTSRYFTPTQLNIIAGGGTFIIAQDSVGGAIYIRHQISTDMTDANTSELSITKNLDAITKFIRPDMKKLIGKYNITTEFLAVARTMIINKLDYLKTKTITETAGGMITDFDATGIVIEQDPILRTRVISKVPISLPYPLNNWDLTLFVQ